MKNKRPYLTVVGMGPGHRDYVLPAALLMVAQATVLIGGKRILADYARDEQVTWEVGSDLLGLTSFLRTHLMAFPVVMVSGDPGFYSLLDYLRQQFAPEEIRVIPGVSSMQVAFARIGLPWQEAVLTSAHGRPLAASAMEYLPGKLVGLLTDQNNRPAELARHFLAAGWPPASDCWVCERLSYDDEQILPSTLLEISEVEGFFHSVMIVKGGAADASTRTG